MPSLITAYFLILGAYWHVKLLVSALWLKRNRRSEPAGGKDAGFLLVVPVLEEERIIRETVAYFLSLLDGFPDSRLVIVTTDKELSNRARERESFAEFVAACGSTEKLQRRTKLATGRMPDNGLALAPMKAEALRLWAEKPNTIDLLAEMRADKLLVINYPRTDGRMAHQLNYAIRYLLENRLWEDGQLLGVYNADSRPEPDTLRYLAAHRGPGYEVFQQYGDYLGNHEDILRRPALERAILLASSAWQNRWSVGFELFNNFKQALLADREAGSVDLLYPFNYCVGHGLFFTRPVAEETGGFSEDTQNEDAVFGLELNFRKRYIRPVPYFDRASSPDSVRSLFLQKATWFFGPFQTPAYYAKLRAKFGPAGHRRLLALSAQLFSHAVVWVLHPLLLFALFADALLGAGWGGFFVVYLVFLVSPTFLSFLLTRGQIKTKAIQAFVLIAFGSFFAYCLHGLSACYTILRTAAASLRGEPLVKYKTRIMGS